MVKILWRLSLLRIGLCRFAFSRGTTANLALCMGIYTSLKNLVPSFCVLMPANLISLISLSWSVPNRFSTLPLASGELAKMTSIESSGFAIGGQIVLGCPKQRPGAFIVDKSSIHNPVGGIVDESQ